MNFSRFTATILVLAACASAESGATTNYALSHSTGSGPRKYYFVGWPAGSLKPVYFRSGLYREGDSATFVRLDDGKLFGKAGDAGVRYPEAFDSLKASRVQPVFIAGSEYSFDGTWVTASVAGRRWVFPRVSGAVTLWSKSPGAGVYAFMDTGAGMEPYREAAVRRKIATRPEAAALLRRERNGRIATWAMAFGGAAVAGVGTATSFGSEGFEPNGLVFAGIGVAALSWLPHIMVQRDYEKAVQAYNAAVGSP
jgi:hypothetical protein